MEDRSQSIRMSHRQHQHHNSVGKAASEAVSEVDSEAEHLEGAWTVEAVSGAASEVASKVEVVVEGSRVVTEVDSRVIEVVAVAASKAVEEDSAVSKVDLVEEAGSKVVETDMGVAAVAVGAKEAMEAAKVVVVDMAVKAEVEVMGTFRDILVVHMLIPCSADHLAEDSNPMVKVHRAVTGPSGTTMTRGQAAAAVEAVADTVVVEEVSPVVDMVDRTAALVVVEVEVMRIGIPRGCGIDVTLSSNHRNCIAHPLAAMLYSFPSSYPYPVSPLSHSVRQPRGLGGEDALLH